MSAKSPPFAIRLFTGVSVRRSIHELWRRWPLLGPLMGIFRQQFVKPLQGPHHLLLLFAASLAVLAIDLLHLCHARVRPAHENREHATPFLLGQLLGRGALLRRTPALMPRPNG